MKLIGLDFDNTLVCYDKLFHKLALEKGLIEQSLPKSKKTIRDYLRSQGQDEEFTLLQGEVYGLRILEAEPAKGMLKSLKDLQRRNIRLVLISHKTRTPYKGPSYDLHKAAWNWLETNEFFSKNGLNWKRSQVFFEETKEKKISRIKALRCSAYIDDLQEILDLIPDSIEKYFYNPENKKQAQASTHKILNYWGELDKMIKM